MKDPLSQMRFSVWQFFTGGNCEKAGEALTAWEAVVMANALVHTLAAQSGTTCRIVVTNSGDFTVWEWRHGEGLVIPSPVSKRK